MNNTQDLSDRAVVTLETRNTRNLISKGNRTIEPLSAFSRGWTRLLALPANPLVMALDCTVWVSGSAVYCLIGRLLPGLAFFALATFLLGLSVSIWYEPRLRALATVRLILVLIGIALVL